MQNQWFVEQGSFRMTEAATIAGVSSEAIFEWQRDGLLANLAPDSGAITVSDLAQITILAGWRELGVNPRDALALIPLAFGAVVHQALVAAPAHFSGTAQDRIAFHSWSLRAAREGRDYIREILNLRADQVGGVLAMLDGRPQFFETVDDLDEFAPGLVDATVDCRAIAHVLLRAPSLRSSRTTRESCWAP